MIKDVTIQPFGRSLAMMYIGVLKYQAVTIEKTNKILEQEQQNIERLKRDEELSQSISYELTSKLIDKRFKTSKSFLKEGDARFVSNLTYKKTTTKEDKILRLLAERQNMQAKTRLNKAVSSYNKKLQGLKTNSLYRNIDFTELER